MDINDEPPGNEQTYLYEMLLGRALDAVEAIDAGDLDLIRRGAARRLAAEDVPALVAEVRRLRDVVRDYEHRITWHTTCQSCAHLLDQCYAETARAEKAEAEALELRVEVTLLEEALDQAREG